MLQTKVDAQCDKCATVVTGGRRFQVIASYLLKVVSFNLHSLHFAPPLWMTPFEFCPGLWHQKTSPYAIVWRCLCDPACTRFSRTPTCDRQTDRQTDRHTTTAYSALTWRRAVIKLLLPSLDAYQTVWHLRRVVLLTENENEQNAVRYGIFSAATGLHLIFINDVTVIWST